MKQATGIRPPEFSRPWDVARLTVPIHLSATADECAAVARRLDLVGVERLEGDLTLFPARGQAVRVKGRMRANVIQTCVVTLDPVPATVDAEIDALYDDGADGDDDSLPDDGEEVVEPIVGGRIDLGELLVQTLSLNLDPYPRAPGATFEGYEIG